MDRNIYDDISPSHLIGIKANQIANTILIIINDRIANHLGRRSDQNHTRNAISCI